MVSTDYVKAIVRAVRVPAETLAVAVNHEAQTQVTERGKRSSKVA